MCSRVVLFKRKCQIWIVYKNSFAHLPPHAHNALSKKSVAILWKVLIVYVVSNVLKRAYDLPVQDILEGEEEYIHSFLQEGTSDKF